MGSKRKKEIAPHREAVIRDDCAACLDGDRTHSHYENEDEDAERTPQIGDHLFVTRAGAASRWAKKLGISFARSIAVVAAVKKSAHVKKSGLLLTVDICGKRAVTPWPTPNLMAGQKGVCCARCGGLNVEYTVWYRPNTDEPGEMFGSWNAGDNTFCNDCELNTELLDGGAEPEEFLAARARHGKCQCDGDNCGETPCISLEGSDE